MKDNLTKAVQEIILWDLVDNEKKYSYDGKFTVICYVLSLTIVTIIILISRLMMKLSDGWILVIAFTVLFPTTYYLSRILFNFIYKEHIKESWVKADNHKYRIGNEVLYENGFYFKESAKKMTIRNYDDKNMIFLLEDDKGNLKEERLSYFLENYSPVE